MDRSDAEKHGILARSALRYLRL